jgi:hypothetical protein
MNKNDQTKQKRSCEIMDKIIELASSVKSEIEKENSDSDMIALATLEEIPDLLGEFDRMFYGSGLIATNTNSGI